MLEARPLGRKLGLICGDRVVCETDAAHTEVNVLRLLPRRTSLSRSNVRGGSEPIVANISLMVVVIAARPAADLFIADRYLCAASSATIAGAVVLNKSDLPDSEALGRELRPYAAAGYRVLECSASSGVGLDQLRELLRAHTSVLVGQSGVGKSSLVAKLCPGIDIATGALDREDTGRHTTTWSQQFDLPGGGAIIDSPGVRDFAPACDLLEPRSLGFPEVDRLSGGCRFADCRHMQEPNCAVRMAVENSSLDARRYESYRRLRRLHEKLTASARPHG